MKNVKLFVIWLYPKFHVFTVICTVSFLAWELYNIEPLQPNIARAIEVIAPNLIDFLSGGSALSPTDFVHQHKQ